MRFKHDACLKRTSKNTHLPGSTLFDAWLSQNGKLAQRSVAAERDPVSATDALDVVAKANPEVKELISACRVCVFLSRGFCKASKQYNIVR